jgi:hypothetical protein
MRFGRHRISDLNLLLLCEVVLLKLKHCVRAHRPSLPHGFLILIQLPVDF